MQTINIFTSTDTTITIMIMIMIMTTIVTTTMNITFTNTASPATVTLEQAVLQKNDALAVRNRAWFEGREILALNLVSSPGAGKTTLLERTIRDLKDRHAFFVIEGDQATTQ